MTKTTKKSKTEKKSPRTKKKTAEIERSPEEEIPQAESNDAEILEIVPSTDREDETIDQEDAGILDAQEEDEDKAVVVDVACDAEEPDEETVAEAVAEDHQVLGSDDTFWTEGDAAEDDTSSGNRAACRDDVQPEEETDIEEGAPDETESKAEWMHPQIGAGSDAADEPDSETDEEPGESVTEAEIQDLDFNWSPPDEEPEADGSEIEDESASVETLGEPEAVLTPAQLIATLECLLFTTTHPLSIPRLRKILGKIDTRTLRGAIAQLQIEYDARASGLQILENVEGYQMCTRPQYADAILQLHRQRKKNPLSTTALETLAIVAYKQPLTRAEIEMIRGVESSGVVRNLSDMGLIKVVGRKEVIGRPQLYGTTTLFLRTFGLRTIEELPTIQNLRRQYGATPGLAMNVPSAQEEESPDDSSRDDEFAAAEESAETFDELEDAGESDLTEPESLSADALEASTEDERDEEPIETSIEEAPEDAPEESESSEGEEPEEPAFAESESDENELDSDAVDSDSESDKEPHE